MTWKEYYEKMIMEPRPAVTRALEYFAGHPPKKKTAYDLGCGNGRDSNALLDAGWHVIAVDSEPVAIEYLKKNIRKELIKDLDFVCMPFEKINWEKVNLINSSYSLPFCSSENFDAVMKSVTESILPGGLFTGNLFGENDEWKELPLVTKEKVLEIFKDFKMISFEENEYDGGTAIGPDKHWHVFEFTALRK
jgi:SAM-dependent methyltransferase